MENPENFRIWTVWNRMDETRLNGNNGISFIKSLHFLDTKIGNFSLRNTEKSSLQNDVVKLLKCPPTLATHELHDLPVVAIFIVGNQQAFKLRHMIFRNDN